MSNHPTKKEKKCRDCESPMESWEHPAAKSCLKCRDPKAYAAKMAVVNVPVKPVVKVPIKPVPTFGEAIGPSPAEAKIEQAVIIPPPCEVAVTEVTEVPVLNDDPTQPYIPRPVVRSNTPFFLRSGDEVSLNLKQRKFLVLPKSRWELNPRKWSGVVPDGIDAVELRMLRICLEAGDIVKGKVFTGIEKHPDTLTKAVELLKRPEGDMRVKLGLVVQHKGLVGGYIPYEIFRYLMRYEDDNEHRRPVLNFLQSALDSLGSGPPKSSPVISKTIEEVIGQKF